MERTELARAYYRALDGGDYDGLAALLAPAFVHDRPDLTLEGRDRFVRFVREERPRTDTTHALDAACDAGGTVLVRGRLLDGDELLVRFVDAFAVREGTVARVTTYTNGSRRT